MSLSLANEEICKSFPKLVQIVNGKLYDGAGGFILDLALFSSNTGSSSTSEIFLLVDEPTTVLQIPKQYKGAFIDYVLFNETNNKQRSGTLIITNNQTELEFTETTTNDIGGDSSIIEINVVLNNSTFDILFLNVNEEGWKIKFTYRVL